MNMRTHGLTIEVDLHGMTVREAERELSRILGAADKRIVEVVVIHGHTGGTALRDFVRKDFRHRRVTQRILSMNPGVTSLMLRP